MKKILSLTVEENIYDEIKKTIPTGEVSPLVNNLLKEYLKKQRERELIEGYQQNAKNKKLQQELGTWERMSAQDVANKLKENEK